MEFENYITDIVQLIENNIDRLNSINLLKDVKYYISAENRFELSFEEFGKLSEIVEGISEDNNLGDKFPKNYIFDKLVKEVIIKSYTYNSTPDEIKSNLRTKFGKFEEILSEELKDWTYFIPVSGIHVEDNITFGSMTIYSFENFKSEILNYLKNNKISKDTLNYKQTMDYMSALKSLCFVKLTTNGTKETSKDKALNKVNELLSIFSLYKPFHINCFGIMGGILPLSSELTTFFINDNDLNIATKSTIRIRRFNLTENLENMKKFHLDYLIEIIHKDELEYVEKQLLNAIQWHYESVKREFNFDEDVAEVTLSSNEYYEHYDYFKLGTKIINLVSSLESLLIFNDKTSKDTRKKRFKLIMNFKEDSYDYSEDLDELYKIRNDIAHSNKYYNLLKLNIIKNTNLIKIFILNFVEIKLTFDKDPNKSLESKDDLNNFYNGKNKIKT